MKGKLVQIKHNAVVAKLINPDRDTRLFVSDILTYTVAGAEHTSAFSKGGWDGNSSFYKMKTDSFPAGFVRYLKKKLELHGAKVQVHRKRVPEPLGPEKPIVHNFGEDPRYDYQRETVRRLVSLKAMIAQIATGGGKSIIFKIACARINRPTLFVTTRKSLMYQMADQMKDTGRPIGILGDGAWNPAPTGINFAIVDTLVARLEEKVYATEVGKQVEEIELEVESAIEKIFKAKDLPTSENILKKAPESVRTLVHTLKDGIRKKIWLKYPEEQISKRAKDRVRRQALRRAETIEFLRKMIFVTLEEAHEVSGNGFYDLMNQCHNADYRLALTATPFMKDNEEANRRLMAVTGPIGIKVSEKLLIDRGILATPYFYFAPTARPAKLYRGTPWQRAYSVGIVEGDAYIGTTKNVDPMSRNEIIVSETIRARSYGLPVMILVQHTAHGKLLNKKLTGKGVKVRFISGNDNQAARQSALDLLKNGDIDCLIGSTILDVGVDVPAVGMVILGGGGKAEVATRQRIGRGLRAKKDGPNVCFVLDFQDIHNNHLKKHYAMRRQMIDDTPGFAEGITSEPFRFEDYDIKKVKI